MWFKNLLVYRFTKPFTLGADELEQALLEKTFTPCGSQDMSTRGWCAPVNQEDAPLVHAANGNMMLCLQRQEKVLPGAVVNEFLDEKIAEIKEREERSVGRKERQELKDEVIFELLPRAFSRTGKLFAYIDPKAGLLFVNAASHKRTEELINYLRESIGSLPLVPLKAKNTTQQIMTHWLKEWTAPEGFEIGGECELKDTADDSAVIRCKNQNLHSQEIKNHLEASMYVNKLELLWREGIECVVDDQLTIKRLKFSDLVMDKAGDVDTESAAEQFDVDFTIMSGEFARFIPALLEAFGGIDTD